MMNEIGILLKFELKDNEFIFKGQALSMRNTMFLCYYQIQGETCENVKDIIIKAEHKLSQESYFDRALWLWVLGEYINKSGLADLLEDLKHPISGIVTEIEENWSKPMKSWINAELQEDLYLTNLSLAYGALLSINNKFKSADIMQLMKTIKAFMFKKFMRGSKLASKIWDNTIMGDIGLAAVPFSMVDAGNQILVEAIYEVEKQLVSKGVRLSANDTYYGSCVRNTLTLLLSWYYSEKGDVPKAKGLLGQVENILQRDGKLSELVPETCKEEVLYKYWEEKNGDIHAESPFVYILYAIAEQNIFLKEKTVGISSKTSIIHTAQGNGNPYLFEVTERYPRFPQEGDSVTVKAITQPYSEDQKLNIIYYVNGAEKGKAGMKSITTKEGERLWEGQIGSFNAYDQVSYKFELIENSEVIFSDSYEFKTRKWVKLLNIKSVSRDTNGISIFYQKIDRVNGVPCLKLSQQKDRIKYSFCLTDNSYVSLKVTNNPIKLDIGEFTIMIDDSGKGFKLLDSEGNTILESHNIVHPLELLIDGSGEVHKLRINLQMADGERLFGTGERYSHFDLRGQSVENYVYNQYRDQGLRTYIPIPFIMSSKGYGIYFNTAFYAQFRFGTRLSDLMEFEVELDNIKQELDTYVFNGNPKNILQSYYEVVGKPELPPKWSFGPWMSSNNWDSQQEACKQLELSKNYQIPSTVIVFEQWSDEATYYIFNDAQYDLKDGNDYLEYSDYRFPEWGRWPDPKRMVEDFHKEGIKVILWQVPVMKYMDGIAHAQRDKDERIMLEKGYHIKHLNGEPYRVPYHEWFKRSLIPDFTNPEAKEWWLNKRLYLIMDIGIDGFKTDGGECIYGDDLVVYDGTPSKAMRNIYPNLYIESYYKFINSYTDGKGVTFSRAGYTGAHRIPLHWAGDERSTFKAFEASIKAGLSSAMSGLTFWGWDLAGFNGDIPTAELYIRSTEMAAFCPVMQYHAETKGEYIQDRTPWNIAERTGNPDVIPIYKKYADLRMNILPYIYQQAMNCCEAGIPLMRPMFMEYPSDSNCVDMYGQYMFGDSLLVAPVIEEQSTAKNVYFPGGKWLNLFDNTIFKGERFERIQAEIDAIPVYIKENSVIPLNLSNEFKLFGYVSNDVTAYKNLCFMIFVTDSLQYRFRDDLGYEVILSIARNGEHIEIKKECSDENLPVKIILRCVDSDIKVYINGKAAQKQVSGSDLLVSLS